MSHYHVVQPFHLKGPPLTGRRVCVLCSNRRDESVNDRPPPAGMKGETVCMARGQVSSKILLVQR